MSSPRTRGRRGALAGTGKTDYLCRMQSRAEYLRAEAAKCKRQAAKAATATAMFIYLDLAADLEEKAKQAEAEDAKSDTK
jgi:hypothetical protein